jgi:hypothetical protein
MATRRQKPEHFEDIPLRWEREMREFELGCAWRGIMHTTPVAVEDQFRMIRDSGVFDYIDRLPPSDLVDEYRRCSEKYGIPLRTGTWYYQLGRDEALLEHNMRNAARAGLAMHNVMIFTRHGTGRTVRDDEIVDCYVRTWDLGQELGVEPSFEVHVNTWSEDFRRLMPVAEQVRARGVRFNFTLDFSHCIFKIENPAELDISGIREDVEAGRVVLDPFEPNNLCDEWLKMGIVAWAQFRPVAPNGPANVWAKDDDGNFGRGIQYPFVKPKPGEWHSSWHAWKLEPSKRFLSNVLQYHLTNNDSPLRFITTEMIDLLDYGQNAKYSLFDQNVACARWIRDRWAQLKAMDLCGISNSA